MFIDMASENLCPANGTTQETPSRKTRISFKEEPTTIEPLVEIVPLDNEPSTGSTSSLNVNDFSSRTRSFLNKLDESSQPRGKPLKTAAMARHTIGAGSVDTVGKYRILKMLGNGSFSTVKLGVDSTNLQKVAVKCIHTEGDDFAREAAKNEVYILKNLQHTNIITLLDSMSTSTDSYLILEYISGGDLFDVLANHHSCLMANQYYMVKRLFRQLVQCIQYVHQQGFCHRDLKVENILILDALVQYVHCEEGRKESTESVLSMKELDDKYGNAPLIKLIDFGLAHAVQTCSDMERHSSQTSSSTVASSSSESDDFGQKPGKAIPRWGSEEYISPEVLISQPNLNPQKADIWALGVILFSLLTGSLPFSTMTGISKKKMYHQIARADFKFPADMTIDEQAKDLVKKILTVNLDRRISIEDILEHPWLQ